MITKSTTEVSNGQLLFMNLINIHKKKKTIIPGIKLTLFWTGGKFAPPPPVGFLNIAQKPLGLGS